MDSSSYVHLFYMNRVLNILLVLHIVLALYSTFPCKDLMFLILKYRAFPEEDKLLLDDEFYVSKREKLMHCWLTVKNAWTKSMDQFQQCLDQII